MAKRMAMALLSIVGVVTASVPSTARSSALDGCSKSQACRLSGNLEISSDGHAWVGILSLDGEECINVSLPPAEAERRFKLPPENVSIFGSLEPIMGDGVMEIVKVDGRTIGYGRCRRDIYLFVKSKRDLRASH